MLRGRQMSPLSVLQRPEKHTHQEQPMSTSGEKETEPEGNLSWDQKVKRTWYRLRAGHEAVMLQDAHESLKIARQGVRKHNSGAALMSKSDSEDPEGDFILGDVTHVHEAPKQTEPKGANVGRGLMSLVKTMVPVAVGAAAILGGQAWMAPTATKVAEKVVNRIGTDANTQYGLSFGEKDEWKKWINLDQE